MTGTFDSGDAGWVNGDCVNGDCVNGDCVDGDCVNAGCVNGDWELAAGLANGLDGADTNEGGLTSCGADTNGFGPTDRVDSGDDKAYTSCSSTGNAKLVFSSGAADSGFIDDSANVRPLTLRAATERPLSFSTMVSGVMSPCCANVFSAADVTGPTFSPLELK